MNLFENFGLSHELITSIKELGFTNPTQIQGQSIPYIIKGKVEDEFGGITITANAIKHVAYKQQ